MTGITGNKGAILSEEFVYQRAPFAQCHASTIAETASGLVAAWFGGSREGHQDVGIWLARSENGRWLEPVELATGADSDGNRQPCWNPVLVPYRDELLLFYKVGPDVPRWWGMVLASSDDGATWSEPRRLPDGFLGPIKNKAVVRPDGALLCPSSTEHNGWRIHMERTHDLVHWECVAPPANAGLDAIQPTLLDHGAGGLQGLCRTRQGRIYETWSQDDGRTWSPLQATILPHPNSGIDAVTLADGRHLLVYNHIGPGQGGTSGPRTPLNVAISEDGRLWQAALVLEDVPGEYSYPAVIQFGDGLVHITYTHRRTSIRHVVIDPTMLQGVPNAGWLLANQVAHRQGQRAIIERAWEYSQARFSVTRREQTSYTLSMPGTSRAGSAAILRRYSASASAPASRMRCPFSAVAMDGSSLDARHPARLVGPERARAQRQDARSLCLAGVADVMARPLGDGVDLWLHEVEPAESVDPPAQLVLEFQRGRADGVLPIAAVATQDHDTIESMRHQRRAYVSQECHQRGHANRDRARVLHVVRRDAIGDQRRHQHGHIVEHARSLASDIDDGARVGVDRQRLAMLLERADGHNDDSSLLGPLRELVPRPFR